jgi:hypothetical protein
LVDTANIVWALLFGAVGIGYFTYGRRQDHKSALLAGIALMIYPYFVSGTLAMVAVGAALLALPFLLKF